MISEGDNSLISNTPCPKPTTLTAVSNSAELSKLGALAYAKFKFTSRNDTFSLNSVGLLDSGANVSLIQIDLLPKRVAKNLNPLDTSVSGVGGNINILGTITDKSKLVMLNSQIRHFMWWIRLYRLVKLLLGQMC